MKNFNPEDTDFLLKRINAGDMGAMDPLIVRLNSELKLIANAIFHRESPGHTLQPSALVHEIYLKLYNAKLSGIEDRTHFLNLAGKAMRDLLIDYARHRKAIKRGGERVRVGLSNVDVPESGLEFANVDILTLEDFLVELAALDPRKAQVVELRFFAGLTMVETAEA